MRNAKMTVEPNGRLVLTVDLNETIGKTKSGNPLIASSQGQVQIPDGAGGVRDERISLAIWRPNDGGSEGLED